MTFFVFEFFAGGGLYHVPGLPASPSLHREGLGMLLALAEDLARDGANRVMTLRDVRFPSFDIPAAARIAPIDSAGTLWEHFADACSIADRTIVIAPECSGLLREFAARACQAGGRLLGPDLEFIAIASDKEQTSARLAAVGVHTPLGCPLDRWLRGEAPEVAFPMVIKPRDGAGSEGIRFVPHASAWSRYCGALLDPGRYRVERYQPGMAASVALLCGGESYRPLRPCRQFLSSDGRFRYLGGQLLPPHPWESRVAALLAPAARWWSSTSGYIGVDLVLGPAEDGSEDHVIEVNPRLTTSYLYLRRAATTNLAEAIWKITAGESATIDFTAADDLG